MREKTVLRQFFKQRRTSLTKAEVALKSDQIALNFLHNLLPKIYEKKSNKIFSIYTPILNEVDTAGIIQYFSDHTIAFCYPKIIAKDHPLTFIAANPSIKQAFTPNHFYPHLLEPDSNIEAVPDFLITPLVAFDKNLNRLGMGGGFFDRTIQHLNQSAKVTTIGLAYDLQKHSSDLALEVTDKALDFIVTESNIFVPS